MKAEIKKETHDGYGILVVDNNDFEHKIGVTFDGEIDGHLCDDYADHPRNRTPNENQYNEQARRFAKYYVYQERGYDTLEHANNPDYVNAVREAIGALSDDEFEAHFGTLYQQLQSHHDESIERPLEIPAEAKVDWGVVYKLDVYLDITHSEITEQPGIEFDQEAFEPVTSVSQSDIKHWTKYGNPHIKYTGTDESPPAISAISDIHIGYPDANGDHQVQRASDPLEREPDATIELIPEYTGEFEDFQRYLEHHLRCQIRDCFARMGLLPPTPFQVIGFGTFKGARRYDYYDMYPLFHSHSDSSIELFS